MKIAIVRGAFLNQFECQIFYPLLKTHQISAFSSKSPIHDKFPFKVYKCFSPMDINFGILNKFKMPVLNRLFIDAHLLVGLEKLLNGYDIAHCADTFYHFTHQCIKAKKESRVKRVVATIFENIPFNNESILGRRSFKNFAIKNIDHFIAISERSKATLILEGVDEKSISVIGQRIDTNRFKPNILNNTNKNTVNILFVGRLEFYKGVYEVIYAAKRLLSDPSLKNFKLKFTLVGDGSERNKIVSLIRKLGIHLNVCLVSTTYENIPNMYQLATIFVAPSRATRTYQEQFSTVLLEAQACGLPIVTTYSGGIPENVEDAAVMANPGDFYSISEGIKKLILDQNLRKYYANKARRHVEKYSIESGASELEKIYEKVLKS